MAAAPGTSREPGSRLHSFCEAYGTVTFPASLWHRNKIILLGDRGGTVVTANATVGSQTLKPMTSRSQV